ncbi:pentapeptide repeat-containing protein [Persephonella sp.]
MFLNMCVDYDFMSGQGRGREKMGRYRVFYFEDLNRGEVIIGCPVCERIERNFIEPVAVILEKEDYKKFEGQLIQIKEELTFGQRDIEILIDKLKEENIYEKIINKDDLVCILHQRKEGKHWEEDTEEFREWNEKIIFSTEGLENKLNEYNLVNQFWCRTRAYRFAVDYKSLWEEVGQDWENFKGNLKDKVDLEEIERNGRDIDVLKIYLKKGNWVHEEDIYNFRWVKFPLFFPSFKFTNITDNNTSKAQTSINFWYEGEELIFRNKANFWTAKFKEANFISNIFQKDVYFGESKFQGKSNFSHTKFLMKAKFHHTEFEYVVNFSNTIFKSEAFFEEAEFKDKINFINAVFEKESSFNKAKIYKEINFIETEFKNKSYFNSAVFYRINFSKSVFEKDIDFSKAVFKNTINFTKTKISKNIKFYESKFLCKEVYFNNCNIHEIEFESIYLAKESHFEIRNCNIFRLKIKNLFNYADIFLISNVKIGSEYKGELILDNCILNDIKFINCDFSQAERIIIKNSFIEDVAFNNVNWGEISENRINPELFEENPKSARDTYRQIKHALDKHSDHINANWFYALEMKAYEKHMKECFLEGLNCDQNSKDYVIFFFNKWISNFGQSWIRPLLLILLFTVLMMFLGIEVNTNVNSIYKYIIPFNLLPSICIYTMKVILLEILLLVLSTSFSIALLSEKSIFRSLCSIKFEFSVIVAIIVISTINLLSINLSPSWNTLAIFLDNFATTLNISNIFKKNITKNSPFAGYLFLYKIYAIFILVLIYQLILAIRRRVRR